MLRICVDTGRRGADPYKIKSEYIDIQNKKYNSIPSAHSLYSRPPCTLSGRADNACTNLLGFFVRYVRTRGMAEVEGSGKTTDFCFAPLPHTLATHGSRD